MSWVRTKNTPAARLLPHLARLYRALTELKAHQLSARTTLQVRMLTADKDREAERKKQWHGQTGNPKTLPQSEP